MQKVNESESFSSQEVKINQEVNQFIKLRNKPEIVIVDDNAVSESDIFGSSSKKSKVLSESGWSFSNKSDIRRKSIRVPVIKVES